MIRSYGPLRSLQISSYKLKTSWFSYNRFPMIKQQAFLYVYVKEVKHGNLLSARVKAR